MIKTIPLNENKLFKRLYYHGKSEVGPLMVLYYLPGKDNTNRLGITTGKKIGNAVVRNRTRRQFKEAYRLLEPQIKSGFDFVLVARSNAVGSDFRKIKAVLGNLLQKAGLMN